MKKQQNRSRSKKNLFNAVLKKWNAGQHHSPVSQLNPKNPLAQTLMVNAVGAAALLGSSNFSFANEDPTVMPEVVVSGQKEKDAYKPETVSSTKYTEPLLNVPQTISVVPKAVIEERGSTTLREVLSNVPGISIQAGEGGVPAGDNLSIRGFSARTDMFIDGVRDFGGYSRDPFNFEQVEVTKGPSSAYAGRGSTGGSVNMVSKAPGLEESIAGTAGVGTDQYERFTIDVNEPIKKIEGMAVRFNALYHDSAVANRDIAENQRWGVAPSVAFGIGTDTRTTLSYFHLQQDNMPDYGVPWVPANTGPLAAYSDKPSPGSWSNFYGLENRDYEKTDTDIATGRVEHDFSDKLSLRNTLRYGRTYRDSIITAPRFASINTSTDITRTDWKSRDQVDEIINNQTEATFSFDTIGLGHTLVPGVEVTQEDEVNYTRVATGPNSQNTSFTDPNPGDAYKENIQRNGARTETDVNSIGVYAFDTVKLTEQWELSGGVRWDQVDTEYKSVAANGVITGLDRLDKMLSWRTGLVYKPVENGSIYAAYGTSFNPSSEGLTLASTATATNNVNTDPEESRSYELGTKWDLINERLGVNAAIFRTDKINARTEDPTNPGDVVVLDGEQRVDGFELGVTGSPAPKWKIYAAYTYLTSEITKSKNATERGKELSNTPNNTFSLWNTYQLPKNFEIGGGLQFVDSRFSSTANTREAPSYLTADAMAAYKVNKNVTLRLNIYNLGDAEYIGSVGGGHFIPGAGRSATVTSEFKF